MVCCMTAPNHCLNQILKKRKFPGNTPRWNFNRNSVIFHQGPCAVCEMSSILFKPQYIIITFLRPDAAAGLGFYHDDVIKWKLFPRFWPFVRGIHRSPVNSSHKGQWRGALMFSLICAWINHWVNSGEAGDLRRYRAHYDVCVMRTAIGIVPTFF